MLRGSPHETRRSYAAADQKPHLNNRTESAGCDPAPATAVAVAPVLSVTVSVTSSGCTAPTSVLASPPHTSLKDRMGFAPLCVMVFVVSYVYWTVQSHWTIALVPSVNDVDRSSQVDGIAVAFLNWHTVVGEPDTAGWDSWNDATMPLVVPPLD